MKHKEIKLYRKISLSNKSFLSKIIALLGFFTPLPIFINLIDFSPYILDFNYSKVTVNSGDALPCPIGVFTLITYLFIVVIRTNSLLYILRNSSIILLILFPILRGFDLLRIPILIAPLVFFLILIRLIRLKYNAPKDGFAIGYIFGIFTLYLLNILSFLVLSLINELSLDIVYARQIFGFEIWQYYVAYSGVASLVFGVIFLYLINNFQRIPRFRTLLISTSFLALVASLLPMRKAAILDILLILAILSYKFLLNLIKLKINKQNLIFSIFVSSIALIGIFQSFKIREINYFLDGSSMQRISAIRYALDLINPNIFQIMFGFKSGFGGISNLFLELFIRNGLFGISFYLAANFYLAKKYFNTMKKISGINKFKNQNILIFILFNVIIGNLVNLNFGIPFYVINFCSIFITFNSLDLISRVNPLVLNKSN